MKVQKIVSLISAICVLLIGITILIVSVMDVELPIPLWIIFSVCNIINAIMIISNYKKKD